MIPKEFVQQYLETKEMFDKKKITAAQYTDFIIKLCSKYQVDPSKLEEYNMELEPKRFGDTDN